MRRLLIVATVAVAVVALASCSSNKDASGTDATAAPTTAASGENQGGGGATATGGEFCQKVAQIGQQYADNFKSVQQQPQFNPTNPQAGMQQMQELGQKLLEPMQQIQASAPPEIKGDVDALVSGFQALASGSPEALATAGAQMGQAGTNFSQYLATNCTGTNLGGFASSGGGNDGGSGTSTGTATGPS